MTWNVLGSARPDRNALAHAIRSLEPDIVALQEIRLSQAHRLANRLGWRAEWAFKHFPIGPLAPWRAEGLAVMSRHQLSQEHVWSLSPDAGRSTYRRRVAQLVTVRCTPAGGDRAIDIRIVNTHLESRRAERAERLAQATRMVAHLDELDAPASLLLGDLNASDEPDLLDAFSAYGLRDSWMSSTPSGGATAPSTQPVQRLDYVLVGPDWRVVKTEVPAPSPHWSALSDHLPVVVDLSWG